MQAFTSRVFLQLRRRERMLVSVSSGAPHGNTHHGRRGSLHLEEEREHENLNDESIEEEVEEEDDTNLSLDHNHLQKGHFDGRLLWSPRDADKAIDLIRDMCNFQVEVLRHNKSFSAAESFIRERPEELTSRLLAHLQYVFQVSQLEGLLPRLNQVYIFNEEMKNFLSVMRELLGFDNKVSDKLLMAEIQNQFSRMSRKM